MRDLRGNAPRESGSARGSRQEDVADDAELDFRVRAEPKLVPDLFGNRYLAPLANFHTSTYDSRFMARQ